MNRTTISAILVFSLLLSTAVDASVSSVATSASSSRATTGTSVTITATATATGTETNGITFISTPSGITVSDPASGQYESVSMSSTPVSKTFTISAGTADTYSYYATSGGTSSTSQTIVFVNPSTLTVSGSPYSTTKNSSQTFALSTSLQNQQADSITTSYKLTCPSGFSVTGDSSCDETKTTTVGGSSTSNLQWTVTVGGTSGTGTLTLQLGDNTDAFSSVVTCGNCVTSSTAAASSAATSTASTTTTTQTTTAVAKAALKLSKGKADVTIPSIDRGKSYAVGIDSIEDMAIKTIEVFVKDSISKTAIQNINIVITKLAEQPSSVSQNIIGTIYHYIQVEKANITDAEINKTKINFKVEKSWLNTSNINESTVVLQRYSDSQWNSLPTAKTSDDATYVYYDAESPGLSVFAITGEKKAADKTSAEKSAENPVDKIAEAVSNAFKKLPVWAYAIIILAIATGAVYFFKFRGRFAKFRFKPRK